MKNRSASKNYYQSAHHHDVFYGFVSAKVEGKGYLPPPTNPQWGKPLHKSNPGQITRPPQSLVFAPGFPKLGVANPGQITTLLH